MSNRTAANNERKLTKFYKAEFRKWHIKLIVMIVLSFVALWVIIFNLPNFF